MNKTFWRTSCLKSEKGAAMVAILATVVVIGLMGAAYGMRLFNESVVTKNNLHSAQAFWIAEAGIQKAAWDYQNNFCRGMKNGITQAPCTSCIACGLGIRTYTETLGNGDFFVVIEPQTKTYISNGYVRKDGSMLAVRKIKVFFGRDYIFGYAAFSQGSLTINNNSRVDSYNSAGGVYDPDTAGSQGNIGTNGTTVNVVEIENNSTIMGNVSTGPGGTVDYNPAKVSIAGGITHTNDMYLEPVSVPSAIETLPLLGVLNVGGTADIQAGSYHFDSIVLGNNGTLNINGHVQIFLSNTTTGMTSGNNTVAINISDGGSLVIYTDGKVDLGNKVIITNNNANKPATSFMIFSRYAGSDGVIIDNNNEFYGAVYAPQTDVVLSNNGALYGSIVGDTVNVSNNGLIHYDEALSQVQAPWQPAEPRDWQEVY